MHLILIPDEDRKFAGSLALDFRSWCSHENGIYICPTLLIEPFGGRTQSDLIERLGPISSIIEQNRTQEFAWESSIAFDLRNNRTHWNLIEANFEPIHLQIETQSNPIVLIELDRAQSNSFERSTAFDWSNFFVRVRLCSITKLNRTQSHDCVRWSSTESD